MAINYIENIPHKTNLSTALGVKELRAASYHFNLPFHLVLEEGQVFYADKVVRIIPRKRIVAFGTWLGRDVVAKLFFDSRHAHRHMEEDAKGMKLLQLNKVPAPALYYQGRSHDKYIHILIYERITDSTNLLELWNNKRNPEEMLPLLKSVMIELATQHVLGLEQKDLHLKNFLIKDAHIYTIDGGQIVHHNALLSKKVSMENLALFLAQLGVGVDSYIETLFKHYAKSRGWLLKLNDLQQLKFEIKKINDARWKSYNKKIFRDSSEFVVYSHGLYKGMYAREYASLEFAQFLKDPVQLFNQKELTILKAGRSTTVAKVEFNGKEYVIKRYNMKSFLHFLRRCLRATRAEKCWRIGQKLSLFGINTAKPVAFIDRRFLGFRGSSYYISEYISGGNVSEYLHSERNNDSISYVIKQIVTMLKALPSIEVTHGDLKITNLLMNTSQQPTLIDLDGSVEHASLSGLKRAWKKDIKRFLKNFKQQPELLERFRMAFKEQ